MKIAVIGAGISGLGAAYCLHQDHDVTLFEKEDRPGGHAHTVQINYDGTPLDVDVGFIVYNTRNYPRLTRLFSDLRVPTQQSQMTFSVHRTDGSLEWGSGWRGLLGQPRNLVRKTYFGMLRDILSFNMRARQDLQNGYFDRADLTLEAYVAKYQYGPAFSRDYLYPMGAAIWSSPVNEIKDFPARYFIHFFENHGLLTVMNHPKWRTVTGGSQSYVQKISDILGDRIILKTPVKRIIRAAQGCHITTDCGHTASFDHIIIASHGDTVLKILSDADDREREAFQNFRTHPNIGYLHRSRDFMPRHKGVWSSWNYRIEGASEDQTTSDNHVGLTYWMNRLQNIDMAKPVFVTLNPLSPPSDEDTFGRFEYRHPIYDTSTLTSHACVQALQGHRRTWYAGAYLGHGFHEDGLASGQTVADHINAQGTMFRQTCEPPSRLSVYDAAE